MYVLSFLLLYIWGGFLQLFSFNQKLTLSQGWETRRWWRSIGVKAVSGKLKMIQRSQHPLGTNVEYICLMYVWCRTGIAGEMATEEQGSYIKHTLKHTHIWELPSSNVILNGWPWSSSSGAAGGSLFCFRAMSFCWGRRRAAFAIMEEKPSMSSSFPFCGSLCLTRLLLGRIWQTVKGFKMITFCAYKALSPSVQRAFVVLSFIVHTRINGLFSFFVLSSSLLGILVCLLLVVCLLLKLKTWKKNPMCSSTCNISYSLKAACL